VLRAEVIRERVGVRQHDAAVWICSQTKVRVVGKRLDNELGRVAHGRAGACSSRTAPPV
jgi:hypothetical protein